MTPSGLLPWIWPAVVDKWRCENGRLTPYCFEHTRRSLRNQRHAILTNTPIIFQQLMDLLPAGLIGRSSLVYLNDIIIIVKYFKSRLSNFQLVMQVIRDACLQLKPR